MRQNVTTLESDTRARLYDDEQLNPQVREALYSEDTHADAFWRAAVPVFLLLQVIFPS